MKKVVKNEFVFPCSAEFHPTNECNQDCVWCIMREYRQEKVSFSQEQLQELGRQVVDGKHVKYFFFSGGGEPLCNDALFKSYIYEDNMYSSLFEMFYKNGISSSISTNGECLNRIVDTDVWKYVEMIRISLDAGREYSYRKLHRSQIGMQLIEVIHGIERYYKKSNKKIEISFLEIKENEGEYRELANLFSLPEAISRIVLKNLIGDREKDDHLAIEVNGIKIVRKFHKDLVLNNYINRTNILINAHGDVYPCCHAMDKEKNKMGNLHIEELDRIILDNQDTITPYHCSKCENLEMNKLLNNFSTIYQRKKHD
ncbi:MAG: radical SAM protein [Lachnospiraceae bacterium]